jgi:N-acetylmuramoyl-L-alanine amidase
MLKKGSQGESVKALQILLMGYDYPMGDYGADADFGGVTESAVKAFQKACDLEVDGVVGPMTWAKLLGV